MKALINMIAVVFSAVLSVAVLADAYIGIDLGRSDLDVSGFDDDTSHTLLVGCNFNQNFGLEVYYTDAGEFDYDYYYLSGSVEVDGWGASLVGRYPLNNDWEVFAKFGAFSWDADAYLDGYGKIASDDGTDNTWGLGLGYGVTENVDLVLQHMRLDVDGDDVDNTSVGLNYNF